MARANPYVKVGPERLTSPLDAHARVDIDFDGDPAYIEIRKGQVPMRAVEQLFKRWAGPDMELKPGKKPGHFTVWWTDKRTGERIDAPVEIELKVKKTTRNPRRNPGMKAPSEKKLLETFRDLSKKDAKLIRALAKATDDPQKLEELVEKVPGTEQHVRQLFTSPYGYPAWRVTVALHAIDQLVEGFGVEPLGPVDMRSGPPYQFINFGDTYATTLIYDRDKDSLFIGSWGDIVEAEGDAWEDNPRRRKPAKKKRSKKKASKRTGVRGLVSRALK